MYRTCGLFNALSQYTPGWRKTLWKCFAIEHNAKPGLECKPLNTKCSIGTTHLIGPTCLIRPTCTIGPKSTIGPTCTTGPTCHIGPTALLGQHVPLSHYISLALVLLTPLNGVHELLVGRHGESPWFSSLSLSHSSSITSLTKEESFVSQLACLNLSTNFCLPFLSLSKHL